MSSRYGAVERWKRPIVANNVIGLLETPARVCGLAQRFVAQPRDRGRRARRWIVAGPLELDGRGRPSPNSP